MSFTRYDKEPKVEIEYCNLCDKLLYIDDIYEVYHAVAGLGLICDCCYMELENAEAKV